MIINSAASAGSLESSDVLVEIKPGNGGLRIEVQSVVGTQFGPAIRQAAEETLRELGVKQADLVLKDRGALDCTIRARVETAARRAERPR